MTNEVVKKEKTMSERFTNEVMNQFSGYAGSEVAVTEREKKLIKGYFIKIDQNLKTAEEARLRKNASNTNEKYNNNLAYSWQNVNLERLALDLVHCARVGLDMLQDNHLFAIPFQNKKTNKYDLNLMIGYSGKEYITMKYALEKPIDVTIELVYSNDTFIPIKKGKGSMVESYTFEINNPFDRGDIVGGFGYISYEKPEKNQLIIMTKAEIEKRKPEYASAEFWGGETTRWVNGKKTTVQLDGWIPEMYEKVIRRKVFSNKYIPIDPDKIDMHFTELKASEIANENSNLVAEYEEKEIETIDIPEAEFEEIIEEKEEKSNKDEQIALDDLSDVEVDF